MHSWYVVQVFSSHEKKVKKALEEQVDLHSMRELIDQIVIPTENVSEMRRGQQHVVEKRLWPGYILIKMLMTEESWEYVKQTPGVVGFVGGNFPHTKHLSEQEVAAILADLESKKQTVTQKHKFEVGDRVKIVEGVFVNFIGTISHVFHDKGRLSVMVSIFGRDTRVDDLEFHQVEEVQDE